MPAVEKSDDLRQEGIDILDSMRFVNDNVLPADLLQAGFLALADFVRSNADVERLSEDGFLYQRSL